MSHPTLTRTASARIPTDFGQFQLCHYVNSRDDKEHLALTLGDVTQGSNVLVRVHSECFTGDVWHSRRCDCGEQLQQALAAIGEEGKGVLIYLRQEGRGIGLAQKLRAYNLQDAGHDTVDANLMLDIRQMSVSIRAAAGILADLEVHSIRLMTNNPAKIEHLESLGIEICARIPVEVTAHVENAGYLSTKADRMRHMLSVVANGVEPPAAPVGEAQLHSLERLMAQHARSAERPWVTLSYAQSLDGSIAAVAGQPLAISNAATRTLTHRLRAAHDAILIGIGTALADDPELTVRLCNGRHPQPVVLDSRLRLPPTAHLLHHPRGALIVTASRDPERRAALTAAGARLIDLPPDAGGRPALAALPAALAQQGLQRVMVEGGATLLRSFLSAALADYVVVTVAPRFVGGLPALGRSTPDSGAAGLPALAATEITQHDGDLVVWGRPIYAGRPAAGATT